MFDLSVLLVCWSRLFPILLWLAPILLSIGVFMENQLSLLFFFKSMLGELELATYFNMMTDVFTSCYLPVSGGFNPLIIFKMNSPYVGYFISSTYRSLIYSFILAFTCGLFLLEFNLLLSR